MTAQNILIVLVLHITAYAQERHLQKLNDESRLLNMHGVTTVHSDEHTIRLRLPDGSTIIKNVQQPEFAHTDTGDLILTPADLDTAAYYSKYKFMAELPLGDVYAPNAYTIVDANKNGRKEIYGNRMRKTVGPAFSHEGVAAFEYGVDSSFKQVLFFPESLGVGSGYGDADGDGLIDMALFKGRFPNISNLLYSQSTDNTFPLVLKTTYDTLAHQIGAQQRTFFDLDGDGRDETIYKVVGSNLEAFNGYPTVVDRYDTLTKTFKNIFIRQINDPDKGLTYTYGLSFGDFDGDGKMNIGTGSQYGYAYTHEYQGNNVFTTKLIAQVRTKNLYLTCVTNDFNKNGKPEVWFGGDTFFDGTAITRLYAFEAVADDQYQKVYQIDILGLFSLIGFGMQSRDMDGDGKDELFVHLAQRILIFKSNAQGAFSLWYIKINELAAAGLNSVVYSSDAADLDGDGHMEFILEADYVPHSSVIKKFSTVFTRNTITSVHTGEEPLPNDFQLFQNYPNPFNPVTNISYALPRAGMATLTVYDLLGKEVAVLVNERKDAGSYTVPFNAAALPSGVYFYRLQSGTFTQTKKMLLLK